MRILLCCAACCMLPFASSASERDAESLLETPVAVDYSEVALPDVVADLSRQIDATISIKKTSINDEGISESEVVTASVMRKMTLQQASHLLFNDLGLTIVPEPQTGLLVLMSLNSATDLLTTKIYDVTDLREAGLGGDASSGRGANRSPVNGGGLGGAGGGGGGGGGGGYFSIPSATLTAELVQHVATSQMGGSGGRSSADASNDSFVEDLISVIQNQTSGPWEEIEGGNCRIDSLASSEKSLLIITADYATQCEVRDLLTSLRAAVGIDTGETAQDPSDAKHSHDDHTNNQDDANTPKKNTPKKNTDKMSETTSENKPKKSDEKNATKNGNSDGEKTDQTDKE